MASLTLTPVAKQKLQDFGPRMYEMANIKKAVTQPPQQIIKHAALSLFRYDDCQAIYRASSLS